MRNPSNFGRLTRRQAIAGAVSATLVLAGSPVWAVDGTSLLRAAYDNWRSTSSVAVINMTIHRPTWERTLTMKSYTRGNDDGLVRFTAPAKDAGNATLKLGNNTWVYNPKLNQVVKLPASLLAQPWMGSDFSYSDLARSEDILKYYTHEIIGTSTSAGHKVYQIEAVPRRGAPVVWGKQVAKVRDDGIMLEVVYYDQDLAPVRVMSTEKVRRLGGRDYPAVLTMRTTTRQGEWTRLETLEAQFDVELPSYLFTQSNLTNPRD